MRTLTNLAILALPLLACECRHLTICELIQQPTIFIGEVIDGGITSSRDDPWHSNVDHVRFKVLENFRGLPAGAQTVDVQLMSIAGMCAPIPYYPGKTYLVVPTTLDGKLHDGPCFQGRDVEKAADDVRQVREYFAGKTTRNVQGQVAVTPHAELVDYLIGIGEAKTLAGVTISTSWRGRTYSAKTNATGKYVLPLPAPGDYKVSAVLKPYTSEPVDITVSGKGCAIQNFGLTIDNTISGRVWDEKGQPVKDARVGLIDLDRRPSESEGRTWFDDAYTEQSDLSFEFENVPLGRYLLVFNPDGPRRGALFDLPLESTYYPLSSNRASARAIEVNSRGVHLTGMDLVVGQHVEFRPVVVQVRFPDGSPMKTAEIHCTGLPSTGEPPWELEKAALEKENGLIQFLAPANRRLQLEVKDWYGRKLSGSYTSIHEPGSSAIKQEFVVTP